MTDLDLLDSDVAQKLATSLGHCLWQGAMIGGLAFVLARIGAKRSGWRYAVNVVALGVMAICLPLNLLWVQVNAETENLDRATATLAAVNHGENTHTVNDSAQLTGEIVATVNRDATTIVNEEGLNDRLLIGTQHPAKTNRTRSTRSVQYADSGIAKSHQSTVSGTRIGNGFLAAVASFRTTYAPLIVLVYVCGVTILLLRLLAATANGWRLRRTASPVPNEVSKLARELSLKLKVRRQVFLVGQRHFRELSL